MIWPLNGRVAGGDLPLKQTSTFVTWLASEQLDLHKKSSEGHLQPRCRSEARSLSRQQEAGGVKTIVQPFRRLYLSRWLILRLPYRYFDKKFSWHGFSSPKTYICCA